MRLTEIRISVPVAGEPVVHVVIAPNPGENEPGGTCRINPNTIQALKENAASLRWQLERGA